MLPGSWIEQMIAAAPLSCAQADCLLGRRRLYGRHDQAAGMLNSKTAFAANVAAGENQPSLPRPGRRRHRDRVPGLSVAVLP